VRYQRRDRDGAQLLQREVKQHELRDVRQRRHHPVERLQPELEEVRGQGVGERIDVAVGIRSFSIDQCDPVAVAPEHGMEFLRERLVLPVPLGAVALGEFGRKRNDAGQHR
jgi:hypothetical protein